MGGRGHRDMAGIRAQIESVTNEDLSSRRVNRPQGTVRPPASARVMEFLWVPAWCLDTLLRGV